MAPALGIDLGTTHCCMAYLEDENATPTVVRMSNGDRTMPSVVAFTRLGHVVGKRAKTDLDRSDENTIFDAKRLLGRRFDDEQVQNDMSWWPFTVVCDPDTKLPKYQVMESGREQLYTPEQISGMVLEEMRAVADREFGGSGGATDAVITVPAYFSDDQRQATKWAADIAGINVLCMINEPTAAALAFALQRAPDHGSRHVLVFDLGGGTLDVALLEHSAEVLQVCNLGGDTHLGGQDFDGHIMALALQAWDDRYPNVVLENGTRAWRRLRLACETAKRDLTAAEVANIYLPELTGPNEDLYFEITRTAFEYQVEPLLTKCIDTVFGVLSQAGLGPADVDDLVVVGGASRIPWLRRALRSHFPPPTQMHMTDAVVNADEAVAMGAAIEAARRKAIIAPPEEKHMHFDPEDLGPMIVDATAHSLGIEHGGKKRLMRKLIKKGSSLPAQGTQVFTSSVANQKVIVFQVYEGEDTCTKGNALLGTFELPVPPGPVGAASVTVTMAVNEDGLLDVTAVDNTTGTARRMEKVAANRMPEAELQEIKANAADRRAGGGAGEGAQQQQHEAGRKQHGGGGGGGGGWDEGGGGGGGDWGTDDGKGWDDRGGPFARSAMPTGQQYGQQRAEQIRHPDRQQNGQQKVEPRGQQDAQRNGQPKAQQNNMPEKGQQAAQPAPAGRGYKKKKSSKDNLVRKVADFKIFR